MLDMLTLHTTTQNATLISIIYTVLVAFVLSVLIAITYEKTFVGLSYSRNFVQSLVLSSIVAAVVVQAIGDSVARGLGMLGALAIIRFRTNFKDPKDIIYMFAALGTGISSGVSAFSIAIVGAVGFCLAATLLYFSPFGQYTLFDGVLKFNIENIAADKKSVHDVMLDFCKSYAVISVRDTTQGKRVDYSYQIKMKKGKTKSDFIEQLHTVTSVRGVNLLLHENTIAI